MPKKTIDQVEVRSQRVLMRVDFNVPLDDDGKITDDRRITAAVPTIRSVIDRGGRLVLMSHLGRPAGTGPEPAFSLAPVADRLRELLPDSTVNFPGDTIGEAASAAVAGLQDGEIVLLENLRFHAEERKADAGFGAALAAFGDIYCNDAFGTSHREDVSMVGVPMAMSGKPRVAGLLLNQELVFLGKVLEAPERPFVAVLGGKKVSDKLGALHNLMNKVDIILVGGAMSYTLLKAIGRDVGKSLVENNMLDDARKIIDEAAASPTDLILPLDHTCATMISEMAHTVVTEDDNIPDGQMGVDLGPKTTAAYAGHLRDAKTIVWNGPMGVFETRPFHVGTKQVATAIATATEAGAMSVVGGGDSAAAIEAFEMNGRFSHVSTGGGASLQMLEGRSFPSVDLLEDGA